MVHSKDRDTLVSVARTSLRTKLSRQVADLVTEVCSCYSIAGMEGFVTFLTIHACTFVCCFTGTYCMNVCILCMYAIVFVCTWYVYICILAYVSLRMHTHTQIHIHNTHAHTLTYSYHFDNANVQPYLYIMILLSFRS